MEASPSTAVGAASGAITALLFTVLHDVLISDIWFNVVPMVLAGAACGATLVWSYRACVPEHTARRWLTYIAACVALLAALGGTSILVLDPRFTMAELMDDPNAISVLLPPAMPLIGAGTLVGTAVLWLAYGRRPGTLVPLLVSQALLVFLVGHNFAVFGLVRFTGALLMALAEFIGLTLLLAGAYAASVLLADAAPRRS